jgi:cadmium resistance protein CadD (predicted permease)
MLFWLGRKDFRYNFARGCAIISNEHEDGHTKLEYLILSLNSYDKFLQRTLRVKINELIHLKIMKIALNNSEKIRTINSYFDPIELHKKGNEKDEKQTKKPLGSKKIQLPFLTVAAITFSGGEEIGIYTTLFAINNEVGAIITLISVAMVLTASWCFLANYLAKHIYLAGIFRSIGSRVLPYVLIGLGIYILAEAFLMV